MVLLSWFRGTIHISLARNFTLAWAAGFISAGTTSVSFYSPFVLICLTLAARGRTDNALCGTFNGPSPRDLTCADYPLSAVVIGRNCMSPMPPPNNCFSPDTNGACALVSGTKKPAGNFNAKRAALCAQILTLNYCTLRSAFAFHVTSRRVAFYARKSFNLIKFNFNFSFMCDHLFSIHYEAE